MKMILQKHTSKFVAGLFNSLGITACVSLTSCSGENNVKQTENQVENLKNKLKTVDFYKSLAEDEGSLKTIADWLNSNGKDSNYKLTAKDLKEIFQNDSKLNEVAGKLEVKLTESDSNRDDENQKSGITLKIDSETTDFVFDKIEDFQKFGKVLVDALLEEKNIQVVGEWSLVFENEKVKICGHKVGFDYIQNLRTFLESLQNVIKFNKFQVPKLSLKIENGKLSLNEVECKDEYYKGQEFWGLVNEYLAFFEIVGGKFEIEKNEKAKVKIDGSDMATVTINGFESSLPWRWVVKDDDKTLVENPGWGNIFKLKGEEKPAEEVTVKFEHGKCISADIKDYNGGVDLNSLDALEKLVGVLNEKTVKIGENKIFSLAFDGKNVKVCGHESGFDVTQNSDFATLLGHVKSLEEVGAVENGFQIKIAAEGDDIKLNNVKISQDFIKKQNFWNAVKAYKELFDKLPIQVKVADSNQGKIGNTVIAVEMFDSGNIVSDWNEVFEKGK